PDVLRAALNPAPQLADVDLPAAVVVGDLQRPEAALAHVQRLERILGLALLALQMGHSHCGLPSRVLRRVTGVAKSTRTRHTSLWNWHLPAVTLRWLPGLHRASPSTPLDVSSYVGAKSSNHPGDCNVRRRCGGGNARSDAV